MSQIGTDIEARNVYRGVVLIHSKSIIFKKNPWPRVKRMKVFFERDFLQRILKGKEVLEF